MRQGPSRSGCIGNGQSRRQTKALQPAQQIGEKLLFSTGKMSSPCDVQEETIRTHLPAPKGDSGRVTRCPQRQASQGGMIGRGIGRANLQRLSDLGPCVGNLIADLQCKCFSRCVQSRNARAARSIDGENERTLGINRPVRRRFACLSREETQNWPARQPDGNDARHDPTPPTTHPIVHCGSVRVARAIASL